MARLLYCKRVAENILVYAMERIPSHVRKIAVGLGIAAALKSLGLLPTLIAMKDLGLAP